MQKKLYRIPEGKYFAGVCTGLAEYFQLDVTLIRLIWAISILLAGTGVLLYLICAFVIPERPYTM